MRHFPRNDRLNVIDLLHFVLRLVTGVVAARYAYAAWGIWGGMGGFLLGALSYDGAWHLLAWLFPPRPRCKCGKCRAGDFVIQRDVNGQPIRDLDGQVIIVYACGRMFRLGDDLPVRLTTNNPDDGAHEKPRE